MQDGENEDDYLWRELAFERVQSALDAALTALYIMTSNSMPKEVFIEDVIERVVRMSKMQLYNAVYPEFDPVYRVDPHNKSVLLCLLGFVVCVLWMSLLCSSVILNEYWINSSNWWLDYNR